MKTKLSIAIVLLSPLLLGAVTAYGNDKVTQDCNKKAKGLSGNEYTRVVTACIRRNTSTASPMLAKMSECNQKAGSMVGDAREKLVQKCMQTR
jgi:hypothetical protein